MAKPADKATSVWLSSVQAGQFLGLSAERIRQLAASGEIPGHRENENGPWRFKASDMLSVREAREAARPAEAPRLDDARLGLLRAALDVLTDPETDPDAARAAAAALLRQVLAGIPTDAQAGVAQARGTAYGARGHITLGGGKPPLQP